MAQKGKTLGGAQNRIARKQITKADLLNEIDESIKQLRPPSVKYKDDAINNVIKRLVIVYHNATVHQ